MRESTNLKLPPLKKGSTIFEYKVALETVDRGTWCLAR
jgi:hypothetical protein